MTEQEKTKADAAAYAVEIELLTQALLNLNAYFSDRAFSDGRAEIRRRLDILLEMEGEDK